MNSGVPLSLSVIWSGKDCVETIESTLASIVAIPDVEIVIEDGGSTDGTLDILDRMARRNPRIKLTANSIASSGERLLRGVRRSQGDVIIVCAGGSYLLPKTLKAAVDVFSRSNTAALVCGVGDDNLDILTLLFSRFRPSLQNALLRRSALASIGIYRDNWRTACLEFDIWQRLATDEGWEHFGPAISTSPSGAWQQVESIDELQRTLTAYREIAERLFSEIGFFADLADRRQLMLECFANYFSLMREQCTHLDKVSVNDIFQSLQRTLAHELTCVEYSQSRNFLQSHSRVTNFRQAFRALPDLPPPRRLGRVLQRVGFRAAISAQPTLMEATLAAPLKAKAELTLSEVNRRFAELYAQTADIYEGRGQVEEALKMFGRAEPLHDIWTDSVALQTAGKMPGVTTDDVIKMHRRWVDRHVGRTEQLKTPLSRPYRGDRKIRIGYYCAFLDSEYMRFLWQKVIAAIDRKAFEVFGYGPAKVADDIAAAFDTVRYLGSAESDPTAIRVAHMRTISDDRFIRMVQDDQIDILIELTGYSPGHRLAAMARRCAPIQVMHMNHPFTSGVPNIDYYMTDNITSPEGDSDFHTEQLVRLPRAIVCFDYRDSDSPPIVDPPALTRGYVTFGSVGGGQKFNATLLELWSKVLHRVPHSKLHLQNNQMRNADARRLITSRFEKAGIAPERIVLIPGVNRDSLMKQLGEIDICLDTWPYNGGLSTAEPLWQGVPVVGYYGEGLRDRYGAALLAAAGCSKLVARSFDEYVDIAAELAADPKRLCSLRYGLRDMCTEHGLNDSIGMARSLEAAYRKMVVELDEHSGQRHPVGSDHIAVP